MTLSKVREKLVAYINQADEKKLKAIYTMVEDEINSRPEWWNDEELVKQLETEYAAWEAGKTKGYSKQQILDEIRTMKTK